MMINVYGHPYSPYTHRVLFLLEEILEPYNFSVVKLEESKQRDPHYLAINPYGRVPCMEWNGYIVCESLAILRYISMRFEAFQLYPINLEDRAKVDQWLDYTNIHIGIPATELAWNKYWSKIFGHQEDALRSQKLEQRINKELYILERNLEQHHFLLSNTISLADISFLPMAHNLKMAQVSLERYPATQAWYNALINRNSWMRVKQKFINPK